MHPGTAAGIAGAIIGVMGGVIGCGVSIANAARPRERALMIRLSALMAIWTVGLFAWLLLMPGPWRLGAFALVPPLIFAAPGINRRTERARELDQADAHARAGGTAP